MQHLATTLLQNKYSFVRNLFVFLFCSKQGRKSTDVLPEVLLHNHEELDMNK